MDRFFDEAVRAHLGSPVCVSPTDRLSFLSGLAGPGIPHPAPRAFLDLVALFRSFPTRPRLASYSFGALFQDLAALFSSYRGSFQARVFPTSFSSYRDGAFQARDPLLQSVILLWKRILSRTDEEGFASPPSGPVSFL